MNLEFLEKDEYLVIKITDKLDSLNAKEINDEIEKRLSSLNKDVVFDFGNLNYISSAGLQVLISCAKNREEIGKKVFIFKPNEMVDNIINVTGFYSFLKKIDKI